MDEQYCIYFQQLIDELREKYKFTGARKGQPQSWYSFSSGFSGINYGMSFAQARRVRVELYINQGEKEKNKILFDWLTKDKNTIEKEFSETLEWERLDEKDASRIACYRVGSIKNDEQTLKEIRLWSINNLLEFERVFSPRLKKYRKVIGRLDLNFQSSFRATTCEAIITNKNV